MKEVPSVPIEKEKETIEMESDDFILLSSHSESSASGILDTIVSILSKQTSDQRHIKRAIHQPIPSLSRYNVSDAIQFVKQSLETSQRDTISWIVYLKLFLALGLDLRIVAVFTPF